jgi:1-acyl-sn-glycerol-3-phosphate acyltransferase
MQPRQRTLLGDLLWAPWSTAVWLFAFAQMVGLAVVTLPLTVFIPFAKIQQWGPAYAMGWIPRLTFSRLRVHFDAGFDRGRVSMFCQNHVSVLDGHVALGSIPGAFCGMQKSSYLKIPGYGWLMRLGNAIGVPPSGTPGRFEQMAEACRERASRNISILVFPEAHRTLDGKLRPFRRGVFEIARAAGLPLVPVAVRGMFDVLRKGSFVTRPGRIDVYIGPQIETAGLEESEVPELMERVRSIMDDWLERGERADEARLSA